MIKNAQNANIPLNKGISRTPAVAEEGELSTCVNLIPRGGELKPIAPPTETGIYIEHSIDIYVSAAGDVVQTETSFTPEIIAVHNVNPEKHYIVKWRYEEQSGQAITVHNFIGWIDGSEGSVPTALNVDFSTEKYALSAQVVGNTILVLWSDSTKQYFIWRDGEYQDLGAGLPDVKVQLGLRGEISTGSNVGVIEFEETSAVEGYNFSPYITSLSGTTNHRDGHTRWTTVSLPTGKPLTQGKVYRFYNESAFDIDVAFGAWNSPSRIAIPQGGKRDYVMPGTVAAEGSFYLTVYRSGGTVTLSIRVEEGVLPTNNISPKDNVENLTALMATANDFISTSLSESHKFVLPFFARIGLRLYDNSIVNLSAPILLVPNSGAAPAIVTSSQVTSEGNISILAYGYQCDLMYRISSSDKAILQNYGELIQSVVISVSSPVYTYNEGYVYDDNKLNLPATELTCVSGSGRQYPGLYQITKYLSGLENIMSISASTTTSSGSDIETESYGWRYLDTELPDYLGLNYNDKRTRILLPTFSLSELYKKYTEKGQYYVLKDIKISDLSVDSFAKIDLSKIDLSAVETLERVTADESRNTVSGSLSFNYNNRLHLGNITESIWAGDSPLALQGFDNYHNNTADSEAQVRAIVKIVKDGQEIYADTGMISGYVSGSLLYWFYYPDPNAISAEIFLRKGNNAYTYQKAVITLKKHDFLAGAYWFESLNEMPFISSSSSEMSKTIECNKLYYPNKLYVSDAANPFIFRSLSHVTVGSGEIRGMSTAVQALSQGQFGQFPLYVFCSDGIWALEVGSTGVYEAAKPVSRDVLTNQESITQLDNAVAFVTDKGLMCISGSKVELLSEKLDGLVSDDDFIEDTLQTFGTKISETVPFVSHAAQSSEFKTLVQNAKIVYDYSGDRLHVFIEGDRQHYVFSLKTGEWASQILDSDYDLLSVVPGYPETLLQFAGKEEIYSYKATPASEPIVCYALTRSIPFGAPFTRKMLADLRLLGQRTGSDNLRRIAVYISDDEVTWKKLTSLHRMSAKYFRFLVMGYLYEGQSLSGIVAQIVEKYTNKMR